MEVRTIAYMANDKFLLDSYAQNKDPYIELSKICNPDKDDNYHRKMRNDYKTSLLGLLYGMESESLSNRIYKSVEDAQKIADNLFTHMQGVKKFAESQNEYTVNNKGKIKTILGDKLDISDESEDKWSRLSVNYCIQGGSAVLMADGFENIIQTSINEGKINIMPMNVVHDSCQNYFESRFIFDLHPYYYRLLSDYLFDNYGIRYEFDTLVGVNYYDMAELKNKEDGVLDLKGSYNTLTKLCRKLKDDGVGFEITSIRNSEGEELYPNKNLSSNFKPKVYKSYVRQYLIDYESKYQFDESKFNMTIKKTF